jgi:hypothetical protein
MFLKNIFMNSPKNTVEEIPHWLNLIEAKDKKNI